MNERGNKKLCIDSNEHYMMTKILIFMRAKNVIILYIY